MSTLQTFVNGSYVSQSPIADQEELINWYVELMESPGASAKAALYGIPGVETFATASAVGCRGMFTDDQAGRTFAVMGASLVEIDSLGTVTARGTVEVDSNPVTFSTNGVAGGQLLITSGDNAYCYTLGTDTLTLVLTGQATQGAVLYGYGLVFDKATGRVRLSDLNDLTTWDPTQYFERSIGTDPWQAMHVTPYGYICLPGTQTGEFWFNAGASPIPFEPDPSGNFSRGIGATFSIQQAGASVMWLSRGVEGDYTVVRASGFSPERASTHAVELDISDIADDVGVSDAIGQVYGEHGHLFYLLTFPTGDRTWAFDAVIAGRANAWAKRGTWIVEDAGYTIWRNLFHTFAFGKHLVGDPDTAVISELNHPFYTDVEGRVIRRVRRSPAVLDEVRRLIIDKIELLMEVGVGLQGSGSGSDPVIALRISRDGGRTWGNERLCKIGKVGEYWRRVEWRMLGLGRNWAFEFVASDPVPYRLSALYLDVRQTTEGRAAA